MGKLQILLMATIVCITNVAYADRHSSRAPVSVRDGQIFVASRQQWWREWMDSGINPSRPSHHAYLDRTLSSEENFASAGWKISKSGTVWGKSQFNHFVDRRLGGTVFGIKIPNTVRIGKLKDNE